LEQNIGVAHPQTQPFFAKRSIGGTHTYHLIGGVVGLHSRRLLARWHIKYDEEPENRRQNASGDYPIEESQK
jgi:hypothetical protein